MACPPPLPGYNPDQQLFCLAFLANMVVGHHGASSELESRLGRILRSIFSRPKARKLLGEWEVVWGPGVFQDTSSRIADNAMFVVGSKSQTPERLVVAIAGTNGFPFMSYGWNSEDFDVKNTVPWPRSVDGYQQPWIARGTYTGLKILLEMNPVRMPHSQEGTLLDFLRTQDLDQKELIITGHSLGGTLAPVLALWLHEQKTMGSGRQGPKIRVQSFAGATPGNRDFAEYYEHCLAQTTKRIWNDLDVVPRAWNRELMDTIADLYLPDLKPNPLIRWFINWFQTFPGGQDYAQILPASPSLQGTYTPVIGWSVFGKFLKEILHQHINGYIDLLQVRELINLILPDNKALAKLLRVGISERQIKQYESFGSTTET